MKIRLSLFKKLILANIFYAIPVIALVWLMIDAKNSNIDFSKQELKGNQFQIKLENTFLELNKLKIETLYKNKIPSEMFEGVDEKIKDVFQVHKEIGDDLQFNLEGLKKRKRENLELSSFQTRWDDFKKKATTASTEENLKQLSAFIADIRGMITHVGDTSNLILDPDLDSYYLMDITLLALPQIQDRIQDIATAVALKIPENKKLSQQDKIDIAVYAALLKQSDIDRITADLQTVIQEDPNFYGESPTLKSSLEPVVQSFAQAVDNFLKVLNKISQDPESPVSANELMALGKVLNIKSFEVWNASVAELDILLKKRVQTLEKDKYISLTYAMIALLVAGFILFSIANSFNANIKSILSQLKKSLSETKESSESLVNLSNKLSSSTTEQASAVQETASALEEINALVKTTVANTSSVNQSASLTLQSAEKSGHSVETLSSAMKEIANNSEHILHLMNDNSSKMEHITSIISSIGDKTKVINEIVFQTKLLSFNASVEAARAGDAGKGFSVVAEEVGNLATMSGSASKDITGLLENSIDEVKKISEETKNEIERALQVGNEKVNNGNDVVAEFHTTVHEIIQQFKEVKESVDSITRASQEQAQGIDEITQAISRIDSITNENANMSRQAADQSENISKQSMVLEQIVMTIEEEILGKKDNHIDAGMS